MKIGAGYPDHVWQRSNGEQVRFIDTLEVYSRHPYLQLRTGEERVKYGPVDNLNPAIETIFIRLGQRTSQQDFSLVMQLSDMLYPGVRTPRTNQHIAPERGWYSMDLPNLLERFRELYMPQMVVLWRGQDCRQELEDQREYLENLGWIVNVLLITQDTMHAYPERHGCHPVTHEWRLAQYVLRRKELMGMLWAQDPCPFSTFPPDDFEE